MDAHRAAADLPAVEHNVVSLREGASRIGLEVLLVTLLRRGEWMMRGAPGLRLLVELEERKVDHPQRAPAFLREPAIVTDLRAQCAQRIIYDLGPIGAEENQVAGLSTAAREDFAKHVGGEKFDDRR